MTTMLEKAARAFFEAHPWGDLDECGPLHTWETLPDEWREYYRKGTRAVLLAVREPDEAMVEAAIDRQEDVVGTYGCVEPTGEFTENGPSICFTAMIDAILAGETVA